MAPEAITRSLEDDRESSRTRLARLARWDRLCVGGASAALVAAVLPWTAYQGTGVAGLHGDGLVSAPCAVIGLATLALYHQLDPNPLLRRLILGTQVAAAGSVLLVGTANAFLLGAAAGIGVYLTLLAGLVWLGGAVLGWRASEPAPPDDDWF